MKTFSGSKYWFSSSVVCILLWAGVIDAQAVSKSTIGWIEKVGITTENFPVHAKIDTGADNSSLHAHNIRLQEEDGRMWVSFQVTNRDGNALAIKRPVVKKVRVKRKGTEGSERYVINMGICIGEVFKLVNVNLVDRSNFRYQMLIGRSYLENTFIVDASSTYTLQPTCNGE